MIQAKLHQNYFDNVYIYVKSIGFCHIYNLAGEGTCNVLIVIIRCFYENTLRSASGCHAGGGEQRSSSEILLQRCSVVERHDRGRAASVLYF